MLCQPQNQGKLIEIGKISCTYDADNDNICKYLYYYSNVVYHITTVVKNLSFDHYVVYLFTKLSYTFGYIS